MLKRIVKMSFDPAEIKNFQVLFDKNKDRIRGFDGCEHLELLQDINQKNIFFTYSFWEDEAALEKYRNSGVFREIWTETKRKFSQKPEAWSVSVIDKL